MKKQRKKKMKHAMKNNGYTIYTSVDEFANYIIENNISGVYNVQEV